MLFIFCVFVVSVKFYLFLRRLWCYKSIINNQNKYEL